ncbi:hypothetical protein DXO200_19385, partial [Xanthomonas oryzae pv. oryzae]
AGSRAIFLCANELTLSSSAASMARLVAASTLANSTAATGGAALFLIRISFQLTKTTSPDLLGRIECLVLVIHLWIIGIAR